MTVLFVLPADIAAFYADEFRRQAPGRRLSLWPDIESADEVEHAFVLFPEPGLLARFPNLRSISAIGAGVDHILRDTSVPAGCPIARLVQPDLRQRMTEYVVLHVLRHHRQMRIYEEQQRRKEWRMLLPQPSAAERHVGILGLGVLGQDAAAKLNLLGFRTAGWSRAPKSIDGTCCHSGPDGLDKLLKQTEILVCLLPLTTETTRIIDAALLRKLPRGASVINASRGAVLDEEALLACLDDGHISEATLDVFETEPLPESSPLWSHPHVTVTPHAASAALPEPVIAMLLETIARLEAGLLPEFTVDRALGY
ncbi:MAG: glyoxylate/hydroxypyruvate reductase A [Parvibaculum sp.]